MRTLTYNWDLITNLVSREIQLNYRRSFLGILWSQLNPLISVLIFTIIFEKVVPLQIPNYSAYVFTGLLAWNWLAVTLNSTGYNLIRSRDLLRKPNLPSEMLVVVTVASNMVNALLSLPVLFGLLWFNNCPLGLSLLFLPLVMAIEFLFILGLALFISATGVFFYDVLNMVTVLVGIWFYITPVFYRPGSGQRDFEFIFKLNPMNHLVQLYRQVLLEGRLPDLANLVILLLCSLLLCGAGLLYFRRVKYHFVDVL